MTTHAGPPDHAITAAEAARIHAEATAAGGDVWICAPVLDPEPGLTDWIAGMLFPWLSGPEAEPEAELEA